MKIIPDNVEAIRTLSHGFSLMAYSKHSAIEITDDEWDKIGQAYNTHVETYMNSCDLLSEALRQIKPFSKYLRELIMLRAKQT